MAFDDVYDKVTQTFPEIETIVADFSYKTPHICKKVFTGGRVLSTAYKRPMTLKGGHQWWKYVYDESYDCVICLEYQPLAYRTTNRDGYREYCSDPKICAQCPTRYLCTRSKNCVKTVLRHVWKDYEELADDARYTPQYKDLYAKRKETIERVFADAKEKHGMRYTLYRGLAQVSKWVRFKFAAMNLKKLVRWKALRTSFPLLPFPLLYFRTRILFSSIRVLRQAGADRKSGLPFPLPMEPHEMSATSAATTMSGGTAPATRTGWPGRRLPPGCRRWGWRTPLTRWFIRESGSPRSLRPKPPG